MARMRDRPGAEISRPEAVILVHGIGRRKRSMRAMETGLARAGFNVVNWGYPSMRQSIAESAESLHECFLLSAATNDRVHFVTHSMGGIVVRCMLKRHPPATLGRIVMIAPPNRGSAVARMLLAEPPLKWLYGPAGQELMSEKHLGDICATPAGGVLIVAGTRSLDWKNPTSWVTYNRIERPNDGTVTVEETKLPGAELVLVADSHTFLAANPYAIAATTRFLCEGTLRPTTQNGHVSSIHSNRI